MAGERDPSVPNPWLVAVVATLAPFMEVLDTSIANVALPHIAGNLGATVDDSTWVLTSYLVSNAVVLPLSAWCSSLFGRRNFYIACVVLFTISSALCGLAPNLGSLVLFRLFQGLGGGGLQPSTQAILIDTFPPRQRGMGMAVYGMTVVVAPVIGPTLGGWITDNFSWRWIFFLNLPIGALSLLLAPRLLRDPPHLVRRQGPTRWRVDWIGLGLLCVALGGLQLVLDLGERHDWFASTGIAVTAGIAVAALVLVTVWEWSHPDPIVDLRLLRDRNLALANLSMLVFGGVLFGSTILLPLMMQTLLGYTALQSGMALSPGGLVILFLMPLVGFLVARVDSRWLIIPGIAVVAWSLHLMAGLDLQTDFRSLVLLRAFQGFGLAFMFVPINTIAYAYVAPRSRNSASALLSLARNIGGSVGISLVSTFLALGAQSSRARLVEHVTAYGPATRAVTDGVADALGGGPDAQQRALGMVNNLVDAQAHMLAFMNEFAWLAVAFLVLVPLTLVMRGARSGTADAPAH